MSLDLVIVDRSWPFRGLGYSPVHMVVAESRLTREVVLERVRARILAAARRRSAPEDAEDLTQEALLLLSTKYAHVESPEELVPLGIAILRKKLAAYWRKSARRRALGEAPLPTADEGERDPVEGAASGDASPEDMARDRQRVRLLARAAARLGPRCRDLLRRKLEGQSFVEMGAELSRPVNTVYSWDHRCHKRLKKLLGDRLAFVSGEEGRS